MRFCMELRPSAVSQGVVGIAGHAGIGHAFSHSGFFQEDSGGFAILLTLLGKACPLDIEIASVSVVDGDTVVVQTKGGGRGEARALHGFTLYEEKMMQGVAGVACAAPQTLASQAYGRIYGQGAGAQGAAFCLAIAKALMDTVRKQWPEKTFSAPEDLPGCCGEYLGGVFESGEMTVSWLLTINASEDGKGPNEDSEGCVPIGSKALLMQQLGMDSIPLLVLEGKAYVPAMDPPLKENALFVRWHNEYDNPVSGQCYARAAQESGYPALVLDQTYPRMDTSLPDEARRLGTVIADLGKAYAEATTSTEKIDIIAQLATICSHDAGGSTYMSNLVHYYSGSGGLWPGMGAMLSFVVTQEEASTWKTLRFTDEELELASGVLFKAVQYLYERREEAVVFVRERRPDISSEALLERVYARHQVGKE